MSQMIRTSHFVNEDIYHLTYKKPKPKETIYEKKVTFTDFHGHFLSKKIVPWVADQGKNLEAFCEMWNEFKCLQEEWGFANGQGAGPAKFQVFRQCVDKRARNQWDSIARSVVTHNNANFQTAVNQLIETCGTTNPRDKVTEYLENPQCVRKRRDTDVHVHGARLELLFFYHDMLPGNTPDLTGDDDASVLKRKMILFKSFPEEWQENFVRNNHEPHNTNVTWQLILQKMELEKNAWDRKAQARASSLRRNGAGRGHGTSRGGHAGRSHAGRGGRGHSRPPQYRPYPNFQQHHRNYQQGQGGYQMNRQPYRSNIGYCYYKNGSYNGGRGRFQPNNNRTQGRFSGRNNGGRGRGFPPRQQHYQDHYHVNYDEQTESYFETNENNQNTDGMSGAGEHGAEEHSGGTPGAAELNATGEHHYNYENFFEQNNDGYDEHYGYEEPEYNYDDVYGAEGDY